MNVLVMGSNGMVGWMVADYLKSLDKYHVYTSNRHYTADFQFDCFNDSHMLYDFLVWKKIGVVINCIGLLVNKCENIPDEAIYINSYFPNFLKRVANDLSTKVIHISTDCVFDGNKGDYKESDNPNETNWYGKTKAMGELIDDFNLTLRTSVIGPERNIDKNGLFEWFLSQEKKVKGYKNVLWTGVTTLQLAKCIDLAIDYNVKGLYHLVPSCNSISKYDLLCLITKIWKKNIKIVEDKKVKSNKTLVNSRIHEIDFNIPNYEQMLIELYEYIK